MREKFLSISDLMNHTAVVYLMYIGLCWVYNYKLLFVSNLFNMINKYIFFKIYMVYVQYMIIIQGWF